MKSMKGPSMPGAVIILVGRRMKSNYVHPPSPPLKICRRHFKSAFDIIPPDHGTCHAVFISYKWENDVPTFVNGLATTLQKRGISVWKDNRSMGAGDTLSEAITAGINECMIFIPVLSEGYVSDPGKNYCQRELSFATQQGKHIIPIVWKDTTLSGHIISPDTLCINVDPSKNAHEVIGRVCKQVLTFLLNCKYTPSSYDNGGYYILLSSFLYLPQYFR